MSSHQRRFYLTTPIYYVTARPHIGTAYTTIACDVLARHRRLRGDDVLFATGVDEHAQKVMRAAQAEGLPVQDFIDGYADAYRKAWTDLHISFDRFIRTSDADHKAAVQEVFRRLLASDDIYKADYQGWYCVPCETYFPESELQQGNCPDCGRPVEQLTQPAYFFRTSRYADAVAQYIESHDGFILPESRRNEVLGFIRSGLRDACISRTGTDFGIKVPGDEEHTVYVWFDALINYLTVAGYPNLDPQVWPPRVQVMGKDILPRFHATIWPAMLLALGIPLPDMLFAHGWWVSEHGDKMSKSKGNVVEPIEVAAQLATISGCATDVAVDAVRYFVLREVQFGLDGSFSQRGLIGRFNADLANDLGNMLNRTLPLVERFLGGECRRPENHQGAFGPLVADVCARVAARMDVLDFRGALEAIWELLAAGNKFIDEKQPWTLHRQGRSDEVAAVLYDALDLVRIVATLIGPFMPSVAHEIWRQLGLADDPTSQTWEACATGRLPDAVRPQKSAPIFPRVDLAALDATTPDAKPVTSKQKGKPTTDMITYEQFAQLDLRVGKVLDVEPVEGADKLYKLTVDIGEDSGPRQLVAGLAQAFGARELLDAYVVVVANLEPATIRGVTSNGMVLAAGEKVPVALVTLDRECPLGTKVR